MRQFPMQGAVSLSPYTYILYTYIHVYTPRSRVPCEQGVRIYMYICINIYMYIYTYIYIYVYTCIYIYIHTYTSIHRYGYVYIHIYIYIHTHTHNVCVNVCQCMYTHNISVDVRICFVSSHNTLLFTFAGWRTCLTLIGHFPQKSPIIGGSFAKNNL